MTNQEEACTYPGNAEEQNAVTPRVIVSPMYKDPVTGALFVHRDLEPVSEPYEEELHLFPVDEAVQVGDAQSLSRYVSRYGSPATTFATYSAGGLRAVLDYHTRDEPGRAQWSVVYQFNYAPQFERWHQALAQVDGIGHQAFVELLEDGMEAIVEPEAAEIMDIVRALRVTSKSTGDTEIRSDGTTAIAFHADTQIRGSKSGEVALPSYVTIRVPVLKGSDVDSVVTLNIRMRASVDAMNRLSFRLSAPDLEEVLSGIYKGVVQRAQSELSDEFEDFEILAG